MATTDETGLGAQLERDTGMRTAQAIPSTRTAPAPCVTVLIPTWNRKPLLSVAVDSVLEQSYQDFEVIVVDDGSTDGTAAMLASRYGADPRVRVIQQENGGVSVARNVGIAAARGTYIALLDSDDRCLPDRLELQVRAFEQHPEAALCLGDAAIVGGGWGDVGPTLYGYGDYTPPTSLSAMFQGGWTVPSSMMLRAEMAKALPFDESLRRQEDLDFLFRFFLEGNEAVFLSETVVLHATESSPEAATRLSEHQALMDEAWCEMFARNYGRLRADQRRKIRLPTMVHRRLARHHLDRKAWSRARPHCWQWWRRRPLRLRPFLRWLRCLRSA